MKNQRGAQEGNTDSRHHTDHSKLPFGSGILPEESDTGVESSGQTASSHGPSSPASDGGKRTQSPPKPSREPQVTPGVKENEAAVDAEESSDELGRHIIEPEAGEDEHDGFDRIPPGPTEVVQFEERPYYPRRRRERQKRAAKERKPAPAASRKPIIIGLVIAVIVAVIILVVLIF